MSIGPIGGVSAAASPAIPKPESTEAPGVPDHDHDSDDSPANAVAHTAAVKVAAQSGRVDVKA